MSSKFRRREFLQLAAGAAAGTAGFVAAPRIITAKKTDPPVILGEGEHKYEVTHNWPQLPDQFTWQTTHDVAFDKAGNLYVIHQGNAKKPDHPAIFSHRQVRFRRKPPQTVPCGIEQFAPPSALSLFNEA